MYLRKKIKKSFLSVANIALTLGVVIGLPVYEHVTWKEPPQYLELTLKQQDDKRWLAIAIYFEARGEGLEGQMDVAKAILKRVADPRWPNTIFEVVTEGQGKRNRCQFSFWCDGESDEPTDQSAWELAQYVATLAYRAYLRGELDTGCAHSYHATYATNIGYFRKLEEQKQVGQHIFYCD